MGPRTESNSGELRQLEQLITTKFTREAIDVDDTIPVELYSMPYERVEIEDEISTPYDLFEIEWFELAPVEVEIDLDAVVPLADVDPPPEVVMAARSLQARPQIIAAQQRVRRHSTQLVEPESMAPMLVLAFFGGAAAFVLGTTIAYLVF